MRSLKCRVVLLIVVLAAAQDSLAQNASPEIDDDRKKLLNDGYVREAESYEIRLEEGDVSPKFNPKAVFSWLNAARVGTPRVQHGGVFVWEHKGRAEILGTIFSQTIAGNPPTYYYELHSLSTGGLECRKGRNVFWDTSKPGIEPKLFPKAPKVSESRRLRMAQMRDLARRFSGYSINYDEKRWELKLLPNPLHRTGEGHSTVLDGSLYTLISTAGTDPEILVLVEARKVGDDWKWHYSVGRFTDLNTFVLLDKKEIVEFPGSGQPYANSARDPYTFRSLGVMQLSATPSN